MTPATTRNDCLSAPRLVRSAALILALAATTLANSITLRPAVTLDAARDLTISDVAHLSGDQAQTAANLTLISAEELTRRTGQSRASAAQITLTDLRAAMTRAGFPASRMAISGSSCEVRIGAAKAVVPAPPRAATPRNNTVIASELLERPTDLRAAIARSLVDFLDMPAASLRLTFDPRDAQWIAQAAASRTVIARPLNTNPASGAIVVDVRLIERADAQAPNGAQPQLGGREADARTVSVKAEVLRPVLRLTCDLPRRSALGPNDFETTEQWVSPGTARASAALDPDRAVGQVARTTLAAGAILSPEVLIAPAAVRRNEYIDVWVYQGNVAVKARAMAIKEGAIGDTIPARLDRQRATFMVRLDGERRGVVVGSSPSK
ncbi:MAG: flagellar basal body P-ring formation chaperone FlgA [Phycisphaerales bacterium]